MLGFFLLEMILFQTSGGFWLAFAGLAVIRASFRMENGALFPCSMFRSLPGIQVAAVALSSLFALTDYCCLSPCSVVFLSARTTSCRNVIVRFCRESLSCFFQ